MKRICLVTSTRAEWGLLAPVAKAISAKDELALHIVATGTHFIPSYGATYKEILDQGFTIEDRIDIQMYPVSDQAISKTMAMAQISFADYFSRNKYDLLVVLGDRYEIMAVCLAAMNARIPIAHIHGGETSQGAIDEAIRHSISKLSYLHFASCEEHRRRIIQLGEHPDRVFNYGAPGIDNIMRMDLLNLQDLSKQLKIELNPSKFVVVTYHPVTLANDDSCEQCIELLEAITQFDELTFLVTNANADQGAMEIETIFEDYANRYSNIKLVGSMGILKYLSALKYSLCALGNSSSGIIEAPYFNIPTVNIGDRQEGRAQASSIINCPADKNAIKNAIVSVLNNRNKNYRAENLYGNGDAAIKIADTIENVLLNGEIDLKKKFYDLTEGTI